LQLVHTRHLNIITTARLGLAYHAVVSNSTREGTTSRPTPVAHIRCSVHSLVHLITTHRDTTHVTGVAPTAKSPNYIADVPFIIGLVTSVLDSRFGGGGSPSTPSPPPIDHRSWRSILPPTH
jgi:hypothetical protein